MDKKLYERPSVNSIVIEGKSAVLASSDVNKETNVTLENGQVWGDGDSGSNGTSFDGWGDEN